MKKWLAVRVGSRAEKKVYSLLSEKNLEFYLPLQKQRRAWSDRNKWVDMPVIHGYVFVHILPEERLAVLQTHHVAGFVRFEGKDAIIPDTQIDAMKCMLGQSDYPVVVNSESLSAGQQVRITAGIMKGLIAELITYHDRNRITVRIPEISFNLMVDLPVHLLETIPRVSHMI